MNIADFQRMILEWGRHNRRDMPWRDTRDPYKILVSEVMLQQTQVSRVLPKYETFLREFPTLEALASCLPVQLSSAHGRDSATGTVPCASGTPPAWSSTSSADNSRGTPPP